jgi:hypothetical protein
MEWLIIDGIGPFFRGYTRKRINWSKAPFQHVEQSGMLEGAGADAVVADFTRFADAVAAAGFNAVTLDDLAHLAVWEGYPAALTAVIARYRALLARLFSVAEARGLRVLITTDVLSLCPAVDACVRGRKALTAWFVDRLDGVLTDFPAIAGIVCRFGESDAIGTHDHFRSRLLLHTPAQTRAFITTILPVFEKHNRTLFFRTWSVGAYSIGDLMWHRGTFRKVFGGLDSRRLVISMKYGESDFFRYLPLNRHFFRTNLPTLIEFQTRREYEGFGEFPAFVGWEYERYLESLAAAPNLVGASVWCQTGGWGKFRRLTYLENSSIWVELNTHVTAALCRGVSCEAAVRSFCAASLPTVDVDLFLVFLSLSDDVIRELLYIREFAAQKLFFRRLRVPPMLFTYWDRFLISPVIRRVLRHMVSNHVLCVEEGERALRKLDAMRRLAAAHGLPDQGLEFQRDTFEILAALRAYLFGSDDANAIVRLKILKKAYRRKWRPRYALKFDFEPDRQVPFRLRWLRRLMFREQRGYRMLDSVVTLRLLSFLYPLLLPWRHRFLPKFARKQAMGIDALFR